ncbi:arginine decarboxylase [Microvirga flocculans]|uniref:Arginine decarboxylase n=1 Tax=Microvirga flocculans TaxID=217168 RepID=A0A7W6N9U7_9HYPH|nr:decarboxylase [Microvirga flocculans]MBB4042061.1 arginine decarboxylase [Microvirga flocculans]
MSKTAHERIDAFFILHAGRADSWRNVENIASRWQAGKSCPEELKAALADLAVLEEFHASPGPKIMRLLHEHMKNDDVKGTHGLIRRISEAVLMNRDLTESTDESGAGETDFAELLPNAFGFGEHKRPSFETLFVTAQPQERWPALCDEIRHMRRREDEFIYEPVFVSSFEDAFCAAIVNPRIAAVVTTDDMTYRSRHDAPVLRELLDPILHYRSDEGSGIDLARILKTIRPELDIYLLSDRNVEAIAGDPKADCIRRIFYAVEEPLELHLSILEGIAARYETPFFDNLKKYAQRPIGTFHALPIARGKSVFKSEWIRDMGEFYGINLFLAESSATTGGLDSLLEPTGNIKKAQEYAARAFGAQRVFFVTNGTSTSNKMVVQALMKPGDIAIVDRNCHKSHHYGMVLSGGQPLYVEAFPLTRYSMYGAVPLQAIKKAMLDLKAEGRLDKLRLLDLTNCTFDGHMYNTRRVMEECLAIKPDLIFLWDEAWSGFAHWSPFLRPRTAMGAAHVLEEWMRSPEAIHSYERQQAEIGKSPSEDVLLKTRLVPDPRKIRLRVYQTNSTHKSMSAIRQGSMVLVHDVDFAHVESQFHEAVFTHASTSPNQQLIASLDVARRQMELEGYGLVMNAISIALKIREAVNKHPLISKYFRILGADEMIPDEYRSSGFVDFLKPGTNWGDIVKAMRQDEFYLDPTRMTLVCGTAGFDGTQFKGLLASKFNIQLNKTSRNSVLLQSNINNTRSDVAHLVRVLVEISREIEDRLQAGGETVQTSFNARVKSLMEDVPDLPNFSCFHEAFRNDAGKRTVEGDIRTAFFGAYVEEDCEYLPLSSPEVDKRLKEGPELVSANFVIPYPPGFPIMVPGQVITFETIDFMRKLDVKEIHGYESAKGLKLLRADKLRGKAS